MASRATKLLSKSSAHRGVGESVSRLIGVSAHLLAGMAICMDFARKMGDFEAAPQGNLNEGTRVLASRATKLLSNSSAHRLIGESVSRLIGVSAHRLAGLAICDDFMKKMGDFEAACQRRLKVGKGLEASRATQLLSNSSAHR